jgi:hypothetical protein
MPTEHFMEQNAETPSAAMLMLGPPGAPCGRFRRYGGAGDVAQGLEDPAARRVIQGHIVGHFKELRHSAAALLPGQHAGLCQAAAAPLAH